MAQRSEHIERVTGCEPELTGKLSGSNELIARMVVYLARHPDVPGFYRESQNNVQPEVPVTRRATK